MTENTTTTGNAVSDDRVRIFDTTLRDGEQAPGFSMPVEAKLVVAKALQELKVDVIEAGFAAASNGDFNAVQAIAQEISGPSICSLSRLNEKDIDAAARAIEPAAKRRVHKISPSAVSMKSSSAIT